MEDQVAPGIRRSPFLSLPQSDYIFNNRNLALFHFAQCPSIDLPFRRIYSTEDYKIAGCR